jgi:hypothetical protein
MHDQKQHEQISAETKGKTVRSLEWSESDNDTDGVGGYWVITFTDGSVIAFQLRPEAVRSWSLT